jgi:hypothetical protein
MRGTSFSTQSPFSLLGSHQPTVTVHPCHPQALLRTAWLALQQRPSLPRPQLPQLTPSNSSFGPQCFRLAVHSPIVTNPMPVPLPSGCCPSEPFFHPRLNREPTSSKTSISRADQLQTPRGPPRPPRSHGPLSPILPHAPTACRRERPFPPQHPRQTLTYTSPLTALRIARSQRSQHPLSMA